MDRVNWQRTRDILISIICIGIIFWAVWTTLGMFVDPLVILILSMAVAFLLSPLVDFLEKYKVPRLPATLLVYIVVIGVLVGVGYMLIFSLIDQAVYFSKTITNFATALPDTFRSFINLLHNQAGIPDANINAAIAQIQNTATQFAQSLAQNALNFFFIFTNALLDILLIIVLSFYLTVDGKHMRTGLVSVTPRRFLPNLHLFDDALNRVVGNYIRGQLTLAVIIGIGTGFICGATGLGNYALICGVLAFLFETIPMVGPALASIIPILLSLLLPGPFPRTLVIIGLFVVMQVLESNVLGPRIVGHAVGLHPVAAIMSLLVGAQLFGIFGALIATPVVAALWVVISSLYRSARGESVDKMLERKRTGWTLRRPSGRLRRVQNPDDGPGGGDDGDSYVETTVPGIPDDMPQDVSEPYLDAVVERVDKSES